MATPSEVLARQKIAFSQLEWQQNDLLPYTQRRDNTFGQYVSNYHLIRLEPFVVTLVGKSAITICDGRGVEASYLKYLGLRVTATDLCPQHLEQLDGLCDDWRQENAERLSFADEQFDWGMVKAGLHHLPRLMIGLYELLRVAREGVIVLEGHDSFLLRWARQLLFPGKDWEPSGNYVYRFRRREIEKVCLGLDLPGFALATRLLPWKRSHESVRRGSLGYALRRGWFRLLNLFSFGQGNLLAAIIFKREPTGEQIETITGGGFTYVRLSRNPHLRQNE